MNLLSTKIYFPPTRAGTVKRQHLVERLESGLQCKLTLISAPAGYGKTSLVSEWRAGPGADYPAARLALDSADNDLSQFLTYLCGALEEIQPGLVDQAKQFSRTPDQVDEYTSEFGLTSARQAPVTSQNSTLIALLNQLHQLPKHFVLVLDDYHHITSRAVHEAVGFILNHAPSQMHLILITRSDPPLPLAHLRVDCQMVEIRMEHLRFSLTETSTYLQEVMGLRLSPQDFKYLDARTEGWPAGIHLAALSLQGHSAQRQSQLVAEFSGTHRYIIDYLADQVLNRQPDEIRQFLLTTAVLDRFNGELCDALREQSGSQEFLEKLEEANLFLVPLDNQRIWYRYHQLFADFLRRFQRQHHPETWVQLHSRAVEWFEAKGLLSQAVQYALAAGDYAVASRLIEKVRRVTFEQEGIGIMLHWLRALPQETVLSHPVLSINYAWALAHTGYLDEVEPVIGKLERCLAEDPDRIRDLGFSDPDSQQASGGMGLHERLPILLYMLRASVERFRNLELAKKYVQDGLEKIPENNRLDRSIALMFKGHIELLQGNSLGALQSLRESVYYSEAICYTSVYLSAVSYLGQQFVLMGRLQEAEWIYIKANNYVDQQEEPILAGINRIRLAELQLEWNDLEAAEANLTEGLKVAEEGGDFVFQREGYCVMARLQRGRGDLAASASWLGKAEAVGRHTELTWGVAPIKAQQARLAILSGNLDEAQRWAETCRFNPEGEYRFTEEYNLITLARLHLANSRAKEALNILERLHLPAIAAGRFGRAIEILVLKALASQKLGKVEDGLDALAQALRLARPEGYLRVFIDEGPDLSPLLVMLDLRQPVELHGYCAHILQAMRSTTEEYSNSIKTMSLAEDDDQRFEPLSKRETEVLRLIAEGNTNREIANKLFIALGTVKRHTVNIFIKLDAANRTQAVARARELNII